MRIGIIGDALDRQYAGIHYFTKNLVEYLTQIDDQNQYFLFREKKGKEGFNCEEIIVPPINSIPGYQSARLLLKIPAKAREYNIDIMIEPAHFGPFNLPKRIKRVTVIHDLTPLIAKEWHTFNGWFLQKLFLPSIMKRADLIITNSDYTKSDIMRYVGIDDKKIVPTHLGISDIFQVSKNDKILANYGIYKEYFLYQGTLEPRKNLINLISAYERYRDQYPESREQLILSGKKGWKVKDIITKKYSSKYGLDIILLGYVDRKDMPALYSGAKAFVYPSYYEGFGLPVLEAMACGIPVITSNSSSLPEVAGEFAYYFDPNDIETMAKALHRSLSVPEEMLIKQVEYAKTFTWRNTAIRVLKALKRFGA